MEKENQPWEVILRPLHRCCDMSAPVLSPLTATPPRSQTMLYYTLSVSPFFKKKKKMQNLTCSLGWPGTYVD